MAVRVSYKPGLLVSIGSSKQECVEVCPSATELTGIRCRRTSVSPSCSPRDGNKAGIRQEHHGPERKQPDLLRRNPNALVLGLVQSRLIPYDNGAGSNTTTPPTPVILVRRPVRFYGGGEAVPSESGLAEQKDVIHASETDGERRGLVKIHRPPGFRLLYLSDFVFSRKIHTDVLEPTIRDLQEEYIDAIAEGRLLKARWVRLRGYCSFGAALLAQTPISVIKWILKIWKVV